MAHDGSNRPQSPFRANSAIGSAKANMYDANRHSFEQRLRLGFDARLNEFTNLKVIGSATGMSGVDTSWTQSDSKGFNHQRLEEFDVHITVLNGIIVQVVLLNLWGLQAIGSIKNTTVFAAMD